MSLADLYLQLTPQLHTMAASLQAVAARPMSLRSPVTRALLLALFLIALLTILVQPSEHVQRLQQHLPSLPTLKAAPAPFTPTCEMNSTDLLALQERYGFDDTIQYAKRYVQYRPQDIERSSMTKVKGELLPDSFETIDVHSPPAVAACAAPLELPVPLPRFPETVDASDFLFGISTTYKRLTDAKIGPVQEWSHWLTDGNGKSNGAGLVLLLVDATDAEIDHASKMIRKLGIDVKVHHSDSTVAMAERYLSLLPTLYNHPTRNDRKWLVMCDDDTFFPYMHALIDKFATYDHTNDLYIGTLSEDINNVQRHGSQAFGGAGVFFSVPLAAKVTALFPECRTADKLAEANSGWGPQGDILIRKCIYEHTDVRLTMLHDLWQLDLYGDPSGFYESGLKPLSLHHYKGGMWHIAYPYEYAQVAYGCGEDCILQRFRTQDDFIISNGFSVAYYPRGIDFDYDQIERTFGAAPADYGWNMDYMLGSQRKSLVGTGRKVAWDLKEATYLGGGRIRQVYLRSRDDGRWVVNDQSMFELDGLLELIWIP